VPVPDIAGLRPSGDRCRETLFNWLQPSAQCKLRDLFAGTGVGPEAARAQRMRCWWKIAGRRNHAAAQCRDGTAKVSVEDDAPAGFAASARIHGCCFRGPRSLCTWRRKSSPRWRKARLVPGGLVYLESAVAGPVPTPGQGWEVLKEQQLGEVRMQLFKRLADVPASV
jgi:16S rRNA (guanine966-N2)-methyltransferase